MRAGTLRERVDLEVASETTDSFGDVIQSWAPYAESVPASIIPVTGRESQGASHTEAEITHKVVIRYSSDVSLVSPKDRVKAGSDYFDIQSVINVGERDKTIELHCVERV